MNMIVNLLINTVAVVIAANVIPGIQIAGLFNAIVVAVFMGIVNMIIKPVLVILTLPITIVTLGLFTLVINALMVLLVDRIVPGFSVSGFWPAFWFSIVLSIVSYFLSSLKD